MRPEQGTMQSRAQAMAALLELLTDQPVIICNGFPSREAQKLADRPTHFYMIGSMGNAAAIGVGGAIALMHATRTFHPPAGSASSGSATASGSTILVSVLRLKSAPRSPWPMWSMRPKERSPRGSG